MGEGEGGEMTHEELVCRATRWLKNSMGCDCILDEPHTANNSEIPDAIGWHTGRSIVVECKVGLSDFYSDRQKPSRKSGKGLGRLRYYLTPPGLLRNATLPEYWGLLECHPKTIRKVKEAWRVPNEHVNGIEECDILVKRIGDRLFTEAK